MPAGYYKRTKEHRRILKIAHNKPEFKEIISKAQKGRKHTPREGFQKGHTIRVGSKFSEEHKKKIGLANSGENNGSWKGGATPENKRIRNSIEFRLWREAIFARDNWTCQKCKTRGGKLHPHHIKAFADYPEIRFALDNGITLCKDCHKKTKNYGNKKQRSDT